MNISSIQGVSLFDNLLKEDSKKLTGANTETFEALLNSAMGLIQETEDTAPATEPTVPCEQMFMTNAQ